jgi:ABC-2 type transport system permease protein
MNAALLISSKQIKKTLRHPEETLGLLIQPILWLGVFGVAMRSIMPVGGGYLAFMLPGVVALSALDATVGGGLGWLMERTSGVAKEYYAAPISRASILCGNFITILAKACIQALILIAMGLALGSGFRPSVASLASAIAAYILFCGIFVSVALAGASSIDDPGSYHMVIAMLTMPLLFVSNALYPVDALPPWLGAIAQVNPVSHFVSLFRQPFVGQALGLGSTALSMGVLAAYFALFLGLALRAFGKAKV